MKISKEIHETDSRIFRGLELEKRKFGFNNSVKSYENLSFVGKILENDKESKRFEESISRCDDSFSSDFVFWFK